MDNKRRNTLKASAAGVGALGLAPFVITSARAQSKVTWRLQSHYPRVSTSFEGSLRVIANELERRTDGGFKIELHGSGEISSAVQIFDIVKRGVVEIGGTHPGYHLGDAELFGLYTGVPGVLQSPWELNYYTKRLGLEAAVNEELRKQGMFAAALMAYPLELLLRRLPESDQGLGTLKVHSAGTLLTYLNEAGIAAQHVDGAELYAALSTGVIEGATWGAAQGALSMKLWEVAKFQMRPALALVNDVLLVNMKAFEKLPQEYQTIFTNLVQERYFVRTQEYLLGEILATRTGVDDFDVQVTQFPDYIAERLRLASRTILEKEMKKGELAREWGEKLANFAAELGRPVL
ncbi:MAG: TRAP transporter substrate-binding protein DctP [Burkholderiaceae bacterium]